MREPFRIDFVPPASVDEAEDRRAALLFAIGDIQQQLADPDRVEREDYAAWRRNASVALRCKEEELRRVKRWLKEQHVANTRQTDWQLLAQALKCLETPTTGEARREIADAIRARLPGWYLQQQGVDPCPTTKISSP